MKAHNQTLTSSCDPLGDSQRLQKLDAEIRMEFRKFSDEGQEDEFVGLSLNFADARRTIKEQELEIKRLKELVWSFEGDRAEVIRRQAQIIRHKESEMNRANDKAAHALRQVYVLKKRIAELEAMGIEV